MERREPEFSFDTNLDGVLGFIVADTATKSVRIYLIALVIPLRPIKSVFDNVLLKHGGLPHVLPLTVHLIFLPKQVEGSF